MFRAVIAEDDEPTAEVLRRSLEMTGKVTVVGDARDGLACLKLFEETTPDALILDIDMPELNGIEVAEIALHSDHPPVVAFVTGYQEYAVKAFELAAIDYVVKPFLPSRLAETVERIERDLEQKSVAVSAQREMVAREFQEQLKLRPAKLPVKDYEQGTIRLLDPSAIIYIERRDRLAVLHTADQEFPSYYTVDRLEQSLARHNFFRANRGALINLDHLEHLIPNDDGSYDALLKDGKGTVITVSRSHARELLTSLKP